MHMRFLEKSLEDIIFENDNESLNDRGLDISGKKLRQVRIGNYGIADIVSIKKQADYYFDADKGYKIWPCLYVTVYELKRNEVNVDTLIQVFRYIKGIQAYFNRRKFSHKIVYTAVCIGAKINTSHDFIFIPSVLNYRSSDTLLMYTYRFGIDGIFFDEKSYYELTNEGF